MINNPGASRTLDPTQRSLVTVVGLHDHDLTDADLNLIQSLQDHKRKSLIKNTVCSGCLTYSPFQFSARTTSATALNFTIPAFEVMVNGEAVKIAGNNSADLMQNVVTLPSPLYWSSGSATHPGSLYVVFIEFWYQRLNVLTKMGYAYNTSTNLLYYYPYGCINADPSNLIPNDTVDPFMGNESTERVQLQWAIRVQSIDPNYDFTKYAFGLDASPNSAQIVWATGSQTSVGSTYSYTNMGTINGDTGLWRAGDGNWLNSLGTLDGYSYALPVAVVFQRNSGAFSFDLNPLGTADPQVSGSGFLASNWTSRPDGKYCDVVFPQDVVDTRSVVSLSGYAPDPMLKKGFVDVISGQTRISLARGETPGNLPIATGSMLDYTVSVSPTQVANTNTVGSWDGYRNGIGSNRSTYYSTQAVNISSKSYGTQGERWSVGDAFIVQLPGTVNGTIESISVQALVNSPLTGTKSPVLLLSGQIAVTGLGTQTVTVTLAKNLAGTTYDPGINPLYVTLGVEYPANTGVDLAIIPHTLFGGTLYDGAVGKNFPVYGVSDYATTAPLATVVSGEAVAYNPHYSDVVFGTRVNVTVSGSTGVVSTSQSGDQITTFALTRTGLPGNTTGLYVISVVDQTGYQWTIASRTISSSGFTLQIQGAVPTTSTLTATFLTINTAQASYSSPVKAITSIEETVLVGNAGVGTIMPDPRVSVVSIANNPGVSNTVLLVVNGGTLTGISGDDMNELVWVQNTNGDYTAVQVGESIIFGGFVQITVPPTVNLAVQPFFFAASIQPAFSVNSSLSVQMDYVPYQGEGVTNRNYEIVHTEDFALVTTNGTGVTPIPGLRDIYPYDRELPICTTLPAQASWSDATLLNQPVSSFFDSNYVAKANNNVEHTFEVPVHTNDFVDLISDSKRKSFQLSVESGQRGYAKALPHMGFAITPVVPRSAVGEGVTSTSGAVVLYVDNSIGSDSNDGFSLDTPFATISAALASLPSVLSYPCSIQIVPTGQPYQMVNLRSSLQVAALGDGVIRASKYYALGVLAYTIQGSGRLVITAQAGTTGNIVIDGTGFVGYGDGPTAAFFIDNTRVLFNQITFQGFTNPAVYGQDCDVEFVSCAFVNNQQAVALSQGSTAIVDGCAISLGTAQTGIVCSQSSMLVTNTSMTVSAVNPGNFITVERGSNLTLDNHALSADTNVIPTTPIVEAELNSSIVTTSTFTCAGFATLSQNSGLSTAVSATPFGGGVKQDSSSYVSITPS